MSTARFPRTPNRRLLLLALVVVCWTVPAAAANGIALQLVANGVPNLVDIQHNGTPGRLFLVDQAGFIRILEGSVIRPTPFLDVSGLVNFGSERGLLGLAFHPNYAGNGLFFIHYSNIAGDNVLTRYQVSNDPNVADPGSAAILLTIAQPFTNHKGGQIRFGPDRFLYIALGDGGSGGDPGNRAQDLSTPLGKILRIDVDAGAPYGIPPDNPFVSTPGARGEIWAYGLRNPWRFSFDRQTGEMFIADVGELTWEEVDMQPAVGGGGRNYGWRLMEGKHCFNPSTGCEGGPGILPIVEYRHGVGCSITGGFRYRGTALAGFAGTYVYGDLCTGIISGATLDAASIWHVTQLLDTTHTITTFGEDADGELYVSNYNSSGQLYRLVPASAAPARLTVLKTQGGNGRITSSPVLLDCGDVCAAELPLGTVVTLAVTADTGSTFFGWMGHPDCVDGAVTLTGDRSCAARFGSAFTDTIVAGSTFVRAIHIIELRSRVDTLRAGAGLPAFTWTDASVTPGGTTITAAHVAELRVALAAAYSAAKQTPPVYTDAGLSAGAVVRAVHIIELRNAVLQLESIGSTVP